jgi:hypothetical protein
VVAPTRDGSGGGGSGARRREVVGRGLGGAMAHSARGRTEPGGEASGRGGVGEVALNGGRAGRHAVERPSSSAREHAVVVVPDAVAYGKFLLALADQCSLRR